MLLAGETALEIRRLEAEIVPVNKRHGVFAVIAAIAIQLTLGVVYIWSVFQTGIAISIFDGDNAAAGLTFSLVLATLAVGSLAGGYLSSRYSTRLVVFVGGLLLSTGFFLASFVTPNISWLLWVTYGIMGGLGMGFTYSTTIACAQKWYPHKKGLVTGVIVSALGFGGVLFTPVAEWLISTFGGIGVGELNTFLVLAIVFFVVCTTGSFFMRTPPPNYLVGLPASTVTSSTASTTTTATANTQSDATSASEQPETEATKSASASARAITQSDANNTPKNYLPRETVKTLRFYLITITFMFGCMGGLMILGFARPIAVANGLEATATIGVMAATMSNSFGRLFWGAISDKLGRINTLIVLLSISAILSLFINMANGNWIFLLIALIGFVYGGLLSNFPSLTADIFGAKNMAANYGLVLLGFGIGAIISSQIAGYFKNLASENIDLMLPAFIIASSFALIGVVMMFVLKRISKSKS